MSILEIIILAVGLAMDAFAVSICKGLAMEKATLRSCAVVGLWFGGFQALMPLLGWLLGSSFASYITKFDHWIAFGLLLLIGGNMIKESLEKDEDGDGGEKQENPLAFKGMLLMAIATSIDALAVGVTFAFLEVGVLAAVLIIGAITFAISGGGVAIGNIFGSRWKSKAELAGGIILVLLGTKILLEHLGVINF